MVKAANFTVAFKTLVDALALLLAAVTLDDRPTPTRADLTSCYRSAFLLDVL